MFVFVRIVLFFIGLSFRFIAHIWKSKPEQTIDNVNVYKTVSKSKSGTITSIKIGVELPSNVFFKITKETKFDRFFKKIGFSEELQTVDHKFDNEFYIACDHLGFVSTLAQNQEARKTLVELFQTYAISVYTKGTVLWMDVDVKKTNNPLYENLLKLRQQLSNVSIQMPSRLGNSFFWKAFLIESLLWGMTGYGIGGFAEAFQARDIILESMQLFKVSLSVITVLSLLLFSLVFLVLKGSSRAHRILIESVFLIFIMVPIAGFVITYDLNINLDKSEAQIAKAIIYNKEVKVHKKRRGGKSYTYHLYLQAPEEVSNFNIPSEVKVDSVFFSKVKPLEDKLVMKIREGYLHIPWFSELSLE